MSKVDSSSQVGKERLKVVVVMPAYNAARTLAATYQNIPSQVVDEVLLVDDASRDETVKIALDFHLKVVRHPHNVGYGGNQKTCYMEALRDGADIVVMLHPDGQYDPRLIPQIIEPIKDGKADFVLGSRLKQKGGALKGGMPLYKFIANRFLTGLENLILGQKLSEMHTGYRAYSREFLERIPFLRNSIIRIYLIHESCYSKNCRCYQYYDYQKVFNVHVLSLKYNIPPAIINPINAPQNVYINPSM